MLEFAIDMKNETGRQELSRREFLRRSGVKLGQAVLLAEGTSLVLPVLRQALQASEFSQNTEELNPNPYPSPYGETQIHEGATAQPSLLVPPSLKPIFSPEPPAVPSTVELAGYNPGEVVWHGDKRKPYVYFTVDDCYDPKMVEKAMNSAEKYGIKLTFFPIGKNVARNPNLFKEVHLRGHAIENHTWDHSWLSGKDEKFISDEIRRQHDAVQNALGVPYTQHFLRPPGGAGIFSTEHPNPVLPITAQSLGYKIAMWTADSNGWRMYPRTDTAAINYIMKNVNAFFFRGSIVLQHALPDDMIALPKIISEALARGWKPITMPQGIA